MADPRFTGAEALNKKTDYWMEIEAKPETEKHRDDRKRQSIKKTKPAALCAASCFRPKRKYFLVSFKDFFYRLVFVIKVHNKGVALTEA